MAIPCPSIEAPATSQSFILNCGSTFTSTSPSFTIDGPAEELTSSWELWWTDVGPNAPDADWIDQKDPVVLGTLPGGMGSYANFPDDGRPVWLRLRCLPEGLDPSDPSNWIDADVCQFTSFTAIQTQPSISNCGATLSSTTYAVTINGSGVTGAAYDIRRSYVSATGPWVDPLSAETPTSFPHTFAPFTGLPTDGSSIWFGLWCREPGAVGFEFVESCEFTAATVQNSEILCIDNQLVRNFGVNDLPQSVIDRFGKTSFDRNAADAFHYRRPGGMVTHVTFTPGAVTATAGSSAQLQTALAAASPGDTIQLTANIGTWVSPATVNGTAGNYITIDLNGFQMGTGGRSYLRGDFIAIINGSVGSIIVVEGDNNFFMELDALAFEVFGPNDASPRPTGNKFFGCCTTSDGTPLRAGFKLSDSTAGLTSNALDTVISRCTFRNFGENAIAGVSEIDFFPRERQDSFTIIYEPEFDNCDEELTTFKSDAFFVYGGITHSGTGHHSTRSSHECAIINHLFVQNRGFWWQAFGQDHVAAGNIIIANTDINPIQTITPHSVNRPQGFIDYAAQGLSVSLVCDNMIFSDNNQPMQGSITIDEYIGPASEQLWQANMEGLDTEGNTFFNNALFGPTATVPAYNDETSNNRMPESEWDAKNPNAPVSSFVAIEQTTANPRVANVTEPYKIGDPTQPFTNSSGQKTVPNFWGSEPLVIPVNPLMLDGTVFNYS